MEQLVLTGVGKRFGRVEALRDLSLAVPGGSFFCLLGPSAAGKTTTLRLVAGLERADAGSVHFDGRDITAMPVQGRPMAMIFQTFALYPHLSVRRNLAYGLREAKLPADEIKRRVGEISEMLRIGHTLDRLPSTLSGGEQQRVAIGRALVRRPKLLLLDEPLTNLDAKLRHDTRAEFKRLHRELGMTMVYATPDQLEALSMGQQVAVIRDGAIVQTATPDALYDAPCDRFVATLVGAPAMNLVPARRRGDGVELAFAAVAEGPWAAPLAGFAAGAELLFGVRPQDLTVARGAAAGPRFAAAVHLTEPLGDITVLDVRAGDALLKMVLPEDEALGYRPGDAIEVEINARNTYLFARDTGVAIR